MPSTVYTPPPVPDRLDDAPTACVLCSHNCSLRVDTEDNQVVAVRADEDSPLTRGYSCNKGYRIGHHIRHAQRLTHPLKRVADGRYEAIGWDQAFEEIGRKLRRIQTRHGPDALAFVGVGGQGNHLGAAFALALLVGTGTRWWFNALAQEKTQRALVDRWMMRSPSDGMLAGHLEESDYGIIFGSNPALSQRGIAPRELLKAFRKSEERTLVVVDPRRTETARGADRHLPIQVGTDVYLLLAMAAILVQEGRFDAQFIGSRTRGFQAVAGVLRGVSIPAMAARCGLAEDDIRAVARDFAAADRAAIEMDLGIEQSRFNTLTAYLIRLILAMTDNYARVGGAVFVGSLLPRLPFSAPAPRRAPISGIEGIPLMSPIPMFSPSLFAEEVLNDRPDRIRAVLVEGSNPVLTYPESPRTRAAFEALELSVVIEPTSTETTAVADYVLPTPCGYEKWEYSGFPKAFPLLGAQVRPPVVSGPPDALPEAEIYHRLGRAMGLTRPAPRMLRALARRALRPLGAAVYSTSLLALALVRGRGSRRSVPMGLSWLYETLGPELHAPQLVAIWALCQGVAWTRRADVARQLPGTGRRWNRFAVGNLLYRMCLENPGGVVLGRLDVERHLEEHLGYDDGRMRLAPEPMLAEIDRALGDELVDDPAFPFILDGGMRTHWTANVNMRKPAWRKGAGPHCALRLAPADAAGLGISRGDLVRVSTRTGHVELPALPEEHVQRGHVHIPNGFGTRYPDPETGEDVVTGVCVNELTDAQDRDPFTGCPHFKFLRCRVERVRPARRDQPGLSATVASCGSSSPATGA